MLKDYGDTLTADVNQKGVLDVDTVKGCTAGMNARPEAGCYGGCYAAKIAKFRGLNFAKAVKRVVKGRAHARRIEQAVKQAPEGFFRIGTMGDPSHAWEHTVRTVEWLSQFATPVIVTKHWLTATDDHLQRLVRKDAMLNTSVSALDTAAELRHRLRQIERYRAAGGVSVARVVSCAFNLGNPEGRRMAALQVSLFERTPVIDNPLRVPRSHKLVQAGVVLLEARVDLNVLRPVTVSVANGGAYVGHCGNCPDKCGLSSRKPGHPAPTPVQLAMFDPAGR